MHSSVLHLIPIEVNLYSYLTFAVLLLFMIDRNFIIPRREMGNFMCTIEQFVGFLVNRWYRLEF